MSWYVYALYNKNAGKIYIGYSEDPNRRLAQHNRKSGNHFTAKAIGEWRLIYKEECSSKSEAIKRE